MRKYHVNNRDRRLTSKKDSYQSLMKSLRDLAKNPPISEDKKEN